MLQKLTGDTKTRLKLDTTIQPRRKNDPPRMAGSVFLVFLAEQKDTLSAGFGWTLISFIDFAEPGWAAGDKRQGTGDKRQATGN